MRYIQRLSWNSPLIKKKKDILKSLYFLTLYDPSKVPGIYFYRTNNIKIKINTPDYKDWCIDGEEVKKSVSDTYKISTINHVQILIPTKNISKLFKKIQEILVND